MFLKYEITLRLLSAASNLRYLFNVELEVKKVRWKLGEIEKYIFGLAFEATFVSMS